MGYDHDVGAAVEDVDDGSADGRYVGLEVLGALLDCGEVDTGEFRCHTSIPMAFQIGDERFEMGGRMPRTVYEHQCWLGRGCHGFFFSARPLQRT